ncbi:MAG: hypothetical protein AB7V08_05065 [Elusimicrobiales bacterium]
MKDLACKICTIRLIECLLTEREMREAKDFARRAVRGGTEDDKHDEKNL